MTPRSWKSFFACFLFVTGTGLLLLATVAPEKILSSQLESGSLVVAGTDVNLVTGAETYPRVTQNTSATWGHGNTVVVAYQDSTGLDLSPSSNCGVSVSTDGGATFTRLSYKFNDGGACYGGPSVLYSTNAAKWFVYFLSGRCGGAPAIGQWESPDGINWTSAPCIPNTSNAQNPASWVETNPGNALYPRQYVAFNNFSVPNAPVRLVKSTDGGLTWSPPVSVTDPSPSAPFRRVLNVSGGPGAGVNQPIIVQLMEEGGGGLNGERKHFAAVSNDGAATFAPPVQQNPPGTLGPGRATCLDNNYFACIYTTPNNGYWRDMGAGQAGVGPDNVMHYVYSARVSGDPGNIYYVRSNNNGLSWSFPLKLNADSTTRAQWGPSLAVNAQGRVVVSWYDERNTAGDSLQRYARASLDNGATWDEDFALSDVIFAKPLQPDPGIEPSNAGSYNHAAFSDDGKGDVAYHTWTDGRVSINGQPQQDVFFDKIKVSVPSFTVTTIADHDDGSCDAADCTLREAINASNARTSSQSIPFNITFALGVTGTIPITVPNTGLNIFLPVNIIGPGARNLTLSGGGTARIFNIPSGAGSSKISGLTLTNGNASGSNSGGGILNGASLSLSDCTLSGNVSAVHGGAIYNNGQNGNASLTLNNCTVSGNSSTGSGGAIFSAAYSGRTTTNLTNCTFDHNIASQYGGAIYSDGTLNGNAALTVTNCTFKENSANFAFGGIAIDGSNPGSTGIATLLLRNTILRTGDAGVNLSNDGGTVTSQGNNLSNDAAGGPPAGTAPGGLLNGTSDLRNTDPQLAALANNGGPTDTAALLPASPAINSGNDALAPKLDQRGYVRASVSDRGAFELNGLPLRITSITRLANGRIMLQGAGVISGVHTIHASPDLGFDSFGRIGNATADSLGTWQYQDNDASGLTKRFYRASFP